MNIFIKTESVIEINNVDHYKKTDIKIYHRLIGKLIYLSYDTRHDILFVISRQNTDLKVGYFKVAKQVVLYFKGIIYLVIIYRANNSLSQEVSNCQLGYRLVNYTNSNYADNSKD